MTVRERIEDFLQAHVYKIEVTQIRSQERLLDVPQVEVRDVVK